MLQAKLSNVYASTARPDRQAEALFSACQFLRPLPNLWTRYFENEWTDFDANRHIRSTGKGMKQRRSTGTQEVKRQRYTGPKIDL